MYAEQRRALLPTEHGIDGFGKFRKVSLVDAACINPEILQSILCCLLAAKSDLSVAAEVGRGAMEEILQSNLLISPCMREDSIPGNVVPSKLSAGEATIILKV